ncbi:MAG: hypothetical protein Q7R50_05790, partial [Dehalococcoidales bacterium]|nr:hypothetical protein [Dehalococcoidales bacterium]
SLGAIDKFMNSLGTRYTMYFNRKYQRVGSLYQGVYKAVMVTNEAQFIYLSKYIHKQALSLQGLQAQPSSFNEYIGVRKTDWVHPEEILGNFSETIPLLSYKNLVMESDDPSHLVGIDLDEEV